MLNLDKFKEQYDNKLFKTHKGLSVSISIEKEDVAAAQWDYYKISAFNPETNENVGDLKMALMEDDKFEKYVGDILKFKQFRGHRKLNVAPDAAKERIEQRKMNNGVDEVQESTKSLLQRKGCWDDQPLNDPDTEMGKRAILKTEAYSEQQKEAIDKMPFKELEKNFKQFVEKTQLQFGDSYQKFIDYHYEKPEAHFVEVEDNYKRKGVATLLYDIANKMVNDKGYKLYQSTTQSPEAQGFWKKQSENGHTVFDEQMQRAYLKPNAPEPKNRIKPRR